MVEDEFIMRYLKNGTQIQSNQPQKCLCSVKEGKVAADGSISRNAWLSGRLNTVVLQVRTSLYPNCLRSSALMALNYTT